MMCCVRLRAIACATLAAISMACSDRGQAKAVEDRRTISKSAYEAAPRLLLSDQRVICSSIDLPECALSSPDDIAVLQDGAYLVHAPESPIALIDSSGNVVRRFGGLGEGPGEFRSVGGLGVTPDGRIWMFDIYTQRKLIYGLGDSADASVVPAPFTADMTSFHAAGDLLVLHNVPRGSKDGDMVQSSFVASDPGGAEREITQLAVPAMRFSESDMYPVPSFFAARPAWDVTSDGTIFYSNGETYDIYTLEPNHTTRLLTVESPLRKVTSVELDRELTRANSKGGLGAQLAQDKADRAPRHHPAVVSVVSLDGDIVAVETSPDTAGSARWDVLDLATSSLIGYLQLDEGEAIVGGDGEKLILLLNDASGAPMLVGASAVRR